MGFVRRSVSHGVLAAVLFAVAAAAASGAIGYAIGSGRAATGAALSPLLDGRSNPDVIELAELARERAAAGARWLAGVSRDDGSFLYIYDPEDDSYNREDYNEVRHAGTTYAMYTAYSITRDADVLEAAERAARYIDDHAVTAVALPGRAFVFEGQMKLGGQALALVALLERRRVLEDTTYDDLIHDLTELMMAMELPNEPGRYYQSYVQEANELSLDPDSDYYPGEALLAFTRLAEQFPDGPYLEHARRAARYLIYERDGDIPAAGEVPREDHWLTMGLAELYRLDRRDEYRQVAYLQANRMIANQHGPEGPAMRIGGSSLQAPINYTSTATKGEALVAVWALARFAADADAVDRYSAAARRNVQFQLRVQYTSENTELFPRPQAAIGAWGKDAVDPWVRIDFVQHNVSALLGLALMTLDGDLPVAEPID